MRRHFFRRDKITRALPSAARSETGPDGGNTQHDSSGFYLIKHDLKFKDLGADFFDRRNREQATRRAVRRLIALGYKVHLDPVASAPA